jgi:hypothetical protein
VCPIIIAVGLWAPLAGDTLNTVPILHTEPLLDYVIAYVKANLGAQIDAVNALHADFQIDYLDPEAILPGGEATVEQYPSLEVAIPEQFLTRPSLGQVDWDARVRVIFRFWADSQTLEYEELYRRVQRYGHALLRLMATPGAFNTGTVTDVATMYRFNPETSERQFAVGAMLQVYTVEEVETRV